jgi:hypothetical protein
MNFTLVGGAALAGIYFNHRTTRDIDLFWRDRPLLDRLPIEVTERLVAGGFIVNTIQRSQSFHRLIINDESETLIVDLVSEPIAPVEPPTEKIPGVLVDTPRELLIQKIGALLSRSELRDLEDVRVLLANNGQLDDALHHAALRDGGFSPPTLAWVLQGFPVALAAAHGFDEDALKGCVATIQRALLSD